MVEQGEENEVAMRYIVFILLAISTFVCSGCRPNIEAEEAYVYSTYINNYFITRDFPEYRFRNKSFDLIVISDRTPGFVVPFFHQGDFDALDQLQASTLKSFLDRNDVCYSKSQRNEKVIELAGQHPLNGLVKFDLSHTLISENEIDQIFSNGGWKEFYRRYPTSRGLISLSRVGFNKKMTQALLYFVQENGGSTGEGYLILFEKSGGEWKRVEQSTVWIT